MKTALLILSLFLSQAHAATPAVLCDETLTQSLHQQLIIDGPIRLEISKSESDAELLTRVDDLEKLGLQVELELFKTATAPRYRKVAAILGWPNMRPEPAQFNEDVEGAMNTGFTGQEVAAVLGVLTDLQRQIETLHVTRWKLRDAYEHRNRFVVRMAALFSKTQDAAFHKRLEVKSA